MATSLLSMAMERGVERVKRRMRATNSGLCRLYRNCGGNYGNISVSVIITFLRSFEVVIIELLIFFLYKAFSGYSPEHKDVFMTQALWISIGAGALAVFMLPTLFGSVNFSHLLN